MDNKAKIESELKSYFSSEEYMEKLASHNTPSPETRIILSQHDGKLKSIEDKIDNLTEKLFGKDGFGGCFGRLEKKFAPKWTEKFIVGFIVTILLYFLGGVLGLFSIVKVMAMANYHLI